MVRRFDGGVLCNDLFKSLIKQNLVIVSLNQEKTVPIAQNSEFELAFKTYLNDKIAKLDKTLGGPTEMFQRKELVVLMCNYVVYTHLFNKPDVKMYKKIWTLQKKAPLIQIGRAHV